MKCKGCHRAWINQIQDGKNHQKPYTNAKRKEARSWPPRSYKAALLEPPPGLPQQRSLKNKQWKSLQGAALQHWENLPEAFKETLGGMGKKQKEEKPTDLKEILKQHLAALPEGLKSQLEGIIQPKAENTEKTAAAKMKASIGTLRDLSNRRDGAQAKVDQSKEQYKMALQDLQDLQKQIDQTQEELKQTTAEYARIAMEKKIEETPIETKVEEETMWQLMEQVGITRPRGGRQAQRGDKSVGNKDRTKITEGYRHQLMFEGDGLTNPFWGISDAAGSLEGNAKMNAEFLNSSESDRTYCSERYGGVRMLGGAGGDGEDTGELEMMQAAAAQIFENRAEVEDERRLAAVRVPFLRELLATFHRISDLPDDITMEEERLYVGEAIQSLQRMQSLLTQTAAGAHHLMDPIDEMFYRRPRHAADLLVQNLTMILKNPNNRCFANSVIRLWAWLPVFNPMKAKEMWGNTTRAMEVILSAPGRIDLEEVPEMEAFWNWHPLEVQADTADFAHSLWSVAQSKGISGRYWATTNYGAVQEKQRMPLDIYPEAGEQSLQELIYAWVEEDHGHYLSSGQEAIILQIGRFQKVDDKWAKHHKPVEIEQTIIFPSSYDGIHVHKQTYKVAGMILHLGQEHSSGHFTTIQCYDDVLWYIDDDQPPEPIEGLTEQMKKEIFMVWLIRDPHQSNSPTMSTITEEDEETKAKKRKAEHKIRLQMLNVTNYGKQVETWAMQLEDPTFLVETHVGTDKMEEKLQFLKTRGKKAIAMPAQPTGQGGTHGGIFLLHDRDQMFHKLEEFSIMGHG